MTGVLQRVGSRAKRISESRQMGILLAVWMITNAIGYIWEHDALWGAFCGLIGIACLVVTIIKDRPPVVPVNLIMRSTPSSEILDDLDDRLGECARKLGREPTSTQMIEVVTDLRGILKDLHP